MRRRATGEQTNRSRCPHASHLPLGRYFPLTKRGSGSVRVATKWSSGDNMLRWTTSLPMPSTYFELVVRAFGVTAAVEAALREGTGVAPEVPGADIPLGQQIPQVRNTNPPLP